MTDITSTTPPVAQVRDLIRAWKRALQTGDMASILDCHADDVLIHEATRGPWS